MNSQSRYKGLNFSQNLISRLENTFCKPEDQIFLDQFVKYLQYDQIKEFVIRISSHKVSICMEMDQIQQILFQDFEENINYKYVSVSGLFSTSPPDYDREIRINIDTFKDLCMYSKKGKQIQKKFQLMEKCVLDQLKQDQDLDRMLRIQAEDREKILLQKIQYQSINKNEFVYIQQTEQNNNSMYKIGRKEDFNNQELLYKQKCIDSLQLENWIKYILNENKYHHSKNFYNCQFEYLKLVFQILGSVQDELLQIKQYSSKDFIFQKIFQNDFDSYKKLIIIQ